MELSIPFQYSLTEALDIAVPGDTLLFTDTLSSTLVNAVIVIPGSKTPLFFRGDKNKARFQAGGTTGILRFEQPRPGTRLSQLAFLGGGVQVEVLGGSVQVDSCDFQGGSTHLLADGGSVTAASNLFRNGTDDALVAEAGGSLTLSQSTVVDSRGDGVRATGGSVRLNQVLIAGVRGAGVRCTGGILDEASGCNDVWDSQEGNWVDCTPAESDVSLDPLFCDPDNGDFTLFSFSPCAPANSVEDCGLIGGRPVACEPELP